MENNEKETIGLKTIVVKYLHHWKFFLIVFVLSFIPAVLYLNIMPRTYEFMASIQLQVEKETSMGGLGMGDAAGLMKSFGIGTGGGSLQVDDEIAILQSNRMLRKMIHELGLNVSYSKPYSLYKMYHDTPLQLTADSAVMENLKDEYQFVVSVTPGHIAVNVKSRFGGHNETYTYTSLPAMIKIGSDEFQLAFNDGGASREKFKLNILCTPLSWVAEDLSSTILIEEVSSSSYVLDITCQDHSIDRGKDMLNTLICKYNEDVATLKELDDRKTMAFVDERIAQVVTDLTQVELDIQTYKTKNDMTLLESDVTMYSEVIQNLRSSIIEMESQAYVIRMVDEYIKDPENKDRVIPSIMTAVEGEKGGTIAKYNEAIIERDQVLKNSNETNPMFKLLDNQVESLRTGVFAMIENARKSTDYALNELKRKEQDILSKMKTVPTKEREYRTYYRNQEILQAIYLMLLQKREETILSLSKHTERARVIEPAYVKKKTVGPRKLYAAIGMLVLTLVIPIFWLLSRDLFVTLKEEYKRTK